MSALLHVSGRQLIVCSTPDQRRVREVELYRSNVDIMQTHSHALAVYCCWLEWWSSEEFYQVFITQNCRIAHPGPYWRNAGSAERSLCFLQTTLPGADCRH